MMKYYLLGKTIEILTSTGKSESGVKDPRPRLLLGRKGIESEYLSTFYY